MVVRKFNGFRILHGRSDRKSAGLAFDLASIAASASADSGNVMLE